MWQYIVRRRSRQKSRKKNQIWLHTCLYDAHFLHSSNNNNNNITNVKRKTKIATITITIVLFSLVFFLHFFTHDCISFRFQFPICRLLNRFFVIVCCCLSSFRFHRYNKSPLLSSSSSSSLSSLVQLQPPRFLVWLGCCSNQINVRNFRT